MLVVGNGCLKAMGVLITHQHLSILVPEVKACQEAVEKALQTSASPERSVPRCKEDGRFEEVQCSEITGECWCIDSLGVELRGTRSQEFITCPGMGKWMMTIMMMRSW